MAIIRFPTMESLDWEDIFFSLSHISGQQFNPFSSENELTRRPNPEQLSWLAKSCTIPESPRPVGDVLRDMQDVFSYGSRVGHPRFFSVVPSVPSPASWLGDAVTSAFNPFAGSWKAGTGVCEVERDLVRWIVELFGLPSSAGGQFVSGASMANLTALTVARDQILGEDVSRRSRAVAYISDQTHFCVVKALKIIGFSDRNVRVLPSDSAFKMDPVRLQTAIARDLRNGELPFLIVGTCGTTRTGSIDPLEELADIANKHHIWMHVDAAYGGSVAFSKTHRKLVDGLKHTQSIAWDAHKWLFQTHGCGAVFFRDRTHPLQSFTTSPDMVAYADDAEICDPWNFGIELTRPARHMRLWFTLQTLGMDTIDQMISRGFHLAKLAEAELRRLPSWEVIACTMAMVTFRFSPDGEDASRLDGINTLISKKLEAANIALVLTTRLNGRLSLRMCTINPQTRDEEIRDVVKALDQKARSVYQGK